MVVILSETILNELNIKNIQRKSFDSGSYTDVYNVGKNKVGKVFLSDTETRDFIIEIYKIMKKYPDVFGNIRITKDGHVIQDKFDTNAFKIEYLQLNNQLKVVDYHTDLDDLINNIIMLRYNKEEDILAPLKNLKNTKYHQPFLKYIKFALKVRNIYQKHKFTFQHKFPDIHIGNLALDSQGNLKIIDFINPSFEIIKTTYEDSLRKNAKKLEKRSHN